MTDYKPPFKITLSFFKLIVLWVVMGVALFMTLIVNPGIWPHLHHH